MSGSLLFVAMVAEISRTGDHWVICDRIGSLSGYALAVALQSVTVYWFVPLQSHVALYVLAVAFGFAFSAASLTALVLCVRTRPRRRALPGWPWQLSVSLPGAGWGLAAIRPVLCFDVTRSYALPFLVCCARRRCQSV